jgi:hypothetical protein
MVECCSHHDELVKAAAGNAAKLDILLKGQEDFKESIEEIKKQLNSQDKESAIDRMKIKPLFVAIGIVMVLVITKLGESVIEVILKAIK